MPIAASRPYWFLQLCQLILKGGNEKRHLICKLFFRRNRAITKPGGKKVTVLSRSRTHLSTMYPPWSCSMQCTCTRYFFFFFKHALVSRPISYLALAQMQSMHSMNCFSFSVSFFLSFSFFFFFFFPSSMHSVILNREYAMKFVMLSIFSPFTTSFKFWARFASHVISYLTDVTSVIVFPISVA